MKSSDLNEIVVFVRVVHAGSFTEAAKQLGMPKSTVSRKITELEDRLKARLLQRTTRKLSLTDVGRTYYDYGARIVAELEAAERAVSQLEETPRGILRVTAPLNFEFLGEVVADYLKRYREVMLDLVCTDRIVDMIEERFDVAIRAGNLPDSSLVARNIGSVRRFVVASPVYLKKRGRPHSPEDLTKHDCMFFVAGTLAPRFSLQQRSRSVEIEAHPRLISNDYDVLYNATVAGLGISLMPAFRCTEDVRGRRLERLLGDWEAPRAPLFAAYPSTRHLSPKARSFVDFLEERMSPPPWERGPIV
jgi:DNA-binding transcriptional LysR family regulator